MARYPSSVGDGRHRNEGIDVDLHAILQAAADADASDIHLVAGEPPTVRVHQVVKHLDFPEITAENAQSMFERMAVDEVRATLDKQKDADFSYQADGLARYRVNAHRMRKGVGLAMRVIKTKVPPLETLGLPDVIEKLTHLPRGLVLVTGDTGSGKSTTLASMINQLNIRERKHVLTLEDPIEYTFESEKCLIQQRELGADMPSFASGLKHALRQDPDIILVGEMRDLDTTALAMSAAETGHLVFSTLHTVNASQTVSRIIDMYPAGQQNQIRAMLSTTLQAVISQTLLSRADRPGMCAAVETLLVTPAVRNLIRENRIFEIPNVIETNRALGMRSLDTAIGELFADGKITWDDALATAVYPEKLEKQMAA
ncbi:MAG: PilT/PilU family type 4a pilus ATPase [Planctomycetota bacterium]